MFKKLTSSFKTKASSKDSEKSKSILKTKEEEKDDDPLDADGFYASDFKPQKPKSTINFSKKSAPMPKIMKKGFKNTTSTVGESIGSDILSSFSLNKKLVS